jgi:chaperonin cofactor prefoldin
MSSFETRREEAKQDLQDRISDVKRGIKRLKERRGRLKGRGAPAPQIEGVENRLDTLRDEKKRLENTDPLDHMDAPDPTPKSFHSL